MTLGGGWSSIKQWPRVLQTPHVEVFSVRLLVVPKICKALRGPPRAHPGECEFKRLFLQVVSLEFSDTA